MTRNPAQSRRDFLAAVLAWADGSALTVAALPVASPALLADFRSLGFDDAGILPSFAAPTRPGALRRVLAAALLPSAPAAPEVEVVPEVLPAAARAEVRSGLGPSFEVLAEERADSGAPLTGVWLRRGGQPVAFAVWRTPPSAAAAPVRVEDWLAPPTEPAVTAALARASLAGAGNARELVFSTPHRRLGLHLRLARFLPRTGDSRLLVRSPGARAARTPDPAGWHLASAARIEPA